MPLYMLAACLALVLAGPALAQQSVTQPSANLNQSQTQTNQSQQPANVSGPGAAVQGQQLGQPSANLNQTQTQQNQGQNARASGPAAGTVSGTGPSR